MCITTTCGKFLKRREYQIILPASCETCRQIKKQQLELNITTVGACVLLNYGFLVYLCDHMDYTVHGILQARILERVAIPFSRGSSQPRIKPRIKPRSPALQADSLLSKPPGKLKNTEVGSLSLLQKIFMTQDLKRGLLHCRQILD